MLTVLTSVTGLLIVGLIFHLFNWGFDVSDAGIKMYAVIFAIIVVVVAVFDGFTTSALADAMLTWFGYMIGLFILRALNLGRNA